MRTFLVVVCWLSLLGCSMPSTTVRSVDVRPSISVANVGDASELYVDGLRIGRAADFQEPNQLRLEPGTHRVSLVENGATIFEQMIFIESEHKTIIAK